MDENLTPQETPPSISKSEQNMGMLCHLLALAGYFIPFGHILGPLVIWMIKREEMPFVESQGKESINFQISITIYAIVAFVLCFLLIGIPILIGLAIMNIICIVLASVQAANGKPYRYPMTIRFLK